jgi:hypothetical protein
MTQALIGDTGYLKLEGTMSSFEFFKSPQQISTVETRHRKIVTPIPAPGTEALLYDLSSHESQTCLLRKHFESCCSRSICYCDFR